MLRLRQFRIMQPAAENIPEGTIECHDVASSAGCGSVPERRAGRVDLSRMGGVTDLPRAVLIGCSSAHPKIGSEANFANRSSGRMRPMDFATDGASVRRLGN
jgi:hypothetical protein